MIEVLDCALIPRTSTILLILMTLTIKVQSSILNLIYTLCLESRTVVAIHLTIGLCEYLGMPFELAGSPAICHALVSNVLRVVLNYHIIPGCYSNIIPDQAIHIIHLWWSSRDRSHEGQNGDKLV